MEGVPYNQKVDVYSFGIVVSELLTRKLPFRDKIQIRGYMDIVDAVLDEGVQPTIPQWCGKHLTNLIELCLNRHVPARPSFMSNASIKSS
jgi:serine/threonine protein kinase